MESYTASLKTILLQAGCRFERQGKGDHEICLLAGSRNLQVGSAR